MNNWRELAACKGQPPSVFFPEPQGSVTGLVARRVCNRCEVRSECLEYAIATRQESGIWGGLTTQERQRFEDNQARRKPFVDGRMNGTRRW